MKLIDYLIEQYGYDEPIFLEDLAKQVSFMSYENLRKTMKRLVDTNTISRFQTGIYYIPKPNQFIQSNSISVNKVINRKYLVRENKRIGYVTGLAFANSIGLTTQNPVNIEVVTSETASIKRDVDLNKATVTLRKPKVAINEKNYKILQILDLLSSFERYSEKALVDAKEKIIGYLENMKLPQNELNKYLEKYSKRTTLNLLESGLYNEITR